MVFTLAASLQRASGSFGDRTAMLDSGRDWATHVGRVARLAGWLCDRGLGAGDRFAIIALNGEAQAELFHAGYWIGAVPVPVNWRLAVAEIADLLADCQPALVFLDPELAASFASGNRGGVLAGAILLDREFDKAIDEARPVAAAELSADADALLLYTGGTTGRAKGVRLSHGNIAANALQTAPFMGFGANSRFLHVAPMFHSADLLGTAVTLLGGAHAFLPRFTPAAFVEMLRQHAITETMLAPTMVAMVLEGGEQAGADSLRALIYGSSPMDAGSIRAICRRFPNAGILQGYGLTETAPLLSILDKGDHQAIIAGNAALAATAGKPLPGVELRIEGGGTGEVMARGPNISAGYFNQTQETASTFVEGWFRTGDIGRIDEQGYLHLLDRAKDMIVTGGENVYSIEVENVLLDHAGVAEAAVIGLPHPKWGEELTAVIVAQGAPPKPEELDAHCRASLGGYKVPHRFIFVGSLPRNALGKVLKHELRAAHQEETA